LLILKIESLEKSGIVKVLSKNEKAWTYAVLKTRKIKDGDRVRQHGSRDFSALREQQAHPAVRTLLLRGVAISSVCFPEQL
jgi:hypothetical protein